MLVAFGDDPHCHQLSNWLVWNSSSTPKVLHQYLQLPVNSHHVWVMSWFFQILFTKMSRKLNANKLGLIHRGIRLVASKSLHYVRPTIFYRHEDQSQIGCVRILPQVNIFVSFPFHILLVLSEWTSPRSKAKEWKTRSVNTRETGGWTNTLLRLKRAFYRPCFFIQTRRLFFLFTILASTHPV